MVYGKHHDHSPQQLRDKGKEPVGEGEEKKLETCLQNTE